MINSMRKRRHLLASDLRGIARLLAQGTAGVTRIVEGVHHSVLGTLGLPGGDAPGQTRGVTGLVYRSIHGVTRLVGQGLDAVLTRLEPLLDASVAGGQSSTQREALVAALNGVMGDHLCATQNPLATPMSLRWQGQVLNGPDWQGLSPALEAKSKVLLLIHGLCMNELQWQSGQEGSLFNHGEALAAALDCTPLYLRYNSGLHISRNGRELSAQLEQLIEHWPVALEELTVVAHSMGGLLIRSAWHCARQDNLRWPAQLKSIVFLGTPHHGAPLERAGNWLDVLLESTPWTAPLARLGQLRSAGITDLRHGNLLDEDWQGEDRFQRQPDRRRPLPLPEGVACHALAATTASRRSPLANRLTGDGLVPLHSALGEHDDPQRCLGFARSSQWIAYRMNHMELLRRPEVTKQMLHWLAPGKAPIS